MFFPLPARASLARSTCPARIFPCPTPSPLGDSTSPSSGLRPFSLGTGGWSSHFLSWPPTRFARLRPFMLPSGSTRSPNGQARPSGLVGTTLGPLCCTRPFWLGSSQRSDRPASTLGFLQPTALDGVGLPGRLRLAYRENSFELWVTGAAMPTRATSISPCRLEFRLWRLLPLIFLLPTDMVGTSCAQDYAISWLCLS